jgi:predicted enzyme related to lactoylglutathione lyase
VSSPVSAVLFARHLAKVAEFYVEVFSARVTHSDAEHVALRFGDFALMIHQIPKQFIDPTELESPPARRERTAIRLDFPVTDLAHARREATRLGGVIDALPPPWAGSDTRFFLGNDPEGNVFGAKSDDR